METATDTKTASAPYFAFKTLVNTADRMKPVGAPPQIDRSVLVGMSGAAQTQFMAGLKSLGLIDERGKVQPRFAEFVKADTPRRKELMGEIVRERYPEAVELGSQNATTEMLVQVFVDKYGVKRGDTARKAIGFYLKAAEYAEDVPISPNFQTPRLRSGESKPRSRRGSRIPAKVTGSGREENPDDDEFGDLHPALAGVLTEIPTGGRGWTVERREQFLRTLEAVINFTVPIVDEDEIEEDEPEDEEPFEE